LNIVRFEDLTIKLYKYIAFYGLLNVFYIMEFDAIGQPCPFSESSKCVLVDYHSLEDYEIKESVDYFLCFGSEYHQENLKWSYDAILNSCTPDLRDILAGKMQVYSDDRKTGPILFMLLVRQLTNVSPQASCIMVNKVVGMKISDFEGESITLVNKTLNAAHKWLTMIHCLPPDFVLIVLDIYETTSVPYFARYLDTFKLHSINDKHMLGHDELMEMAAKFYEEAILSRKWDRSHSSSVFNATPSPSNNISGHPSSGRDHTPTIKNMGNASSGGSSGGKGVCRKNQTSVYTPPPEGGSESKDIFGIPHRYCHVCKRWTFGTCMHFTKDHTTSHNNSGGGNATAPPRSTSTTETAVPPETSARLTRSAEFQRINFANGL
jgi:hypothetical protein